ncbi:PREDICTED: olfactory receptor 2G6-like [Nanorana parkeri]|uniref:olfactory receptor 2G6-like n=1 Tax=Nanorana parkeri TaxID=125878 RepID=UPI0008545379|nr:PREDICTED: olfactory receptor 2G6-like [Nanorana parkeri]
MMPWNYTRVEEFILLGLTGRPDLQIALFVIFLVMYAISFMGNTLIIFVSSISSRLHTPMYFFLSNLSFLDLSFTSSVVPKMLINFLSLKKSISFEACFTQMVIHMCLGGTECCLLLAMAYDRYVAICSPLRYTTIMNLSLCVQMASGCWIGGSINSLIHTFFALRLSFCGPNVINHFFCEIPSVLELACTDASLNRNIIFFCAMSLVMGPFFLILITYGYIISSILKISTSVGRKKAFSTCASHIIVVTLFYGTIIFMYMRPGDTHVANQDKMATLFYSVVTPLLNPLIYTLRNKDVKGALLVIIRKKHVP